jgi:hypothetical protein
VELRLATRASQADGTESPPVECPVAVDASTGLGRTTGALRAMSAPALASEAEPAGLAGAPPNAPSVIGIGLFAALVAAIALNPAALTSTLIALVGSIPKIIDVALPVGSLAAAVTARSGWCTIALGDARESAGGFVVDLGS